MITKIKRIGLSLGLFSIIMSFIFFGRQQEIYQLMLIGGIIISSVFFLSILFSKEASKAKLIWIFIVVLSIGIHFITEPFLIDTSYKVFLNDNKNELNDVNKILANKNGEVSISNDKIIDKKGLLTKNEVDSLLKIKQKLNVYRITKTENGIYYELWGFLDVQLGITFWTKKEKPNINYRHLKDNWYN